MTSDYYVYEHWRPDKDVCFYVGQGRRRRAWSMRSRNPHHRAIVSKLTALGLSLDVRIIHRDLERARALELEIERIAFYGRDSLTNMTHGGDGSVGGTHVVTLEARQRMSEATRGKPKSPEHRATIAKIRTGAPLPASARAKLSAAFKGRILTPEHRLKLSLAAKGKPKSAEHRASLCVARQLRAERERKAS